MRGYTWRPRGRRVLAAAAVAAAGAAALPGAAGAFFSGEHFSGKTTQTRDGKAGAIHFVVSHTNGAKGKIDVATRCDDPKNPTFDLVWNFQVPLHIHHGSGHFDLTRGETQGLGTGYRGRLVPALHGTVGGNRASGTMALTVEVSTTAGQHVATCRSGRFHWSAKGR